MPRDVRRKGNEPMSGEPTIRGATPEDFEEIVVTTATAFGNEGSRWPEEHVARDPNHRPELHRLGEVDGKIVSAMRIVCQDVRYGRAILKHTGVADVGTPPEHRKRGYSTMVLKDAIAHMERLGSHFSMLYTGIQPFYERLGWAILPMREERFNISGATPQASSRWNGEVVQFDASRHLAAYRELYDHFNATRTATTVRGDRYWELRLTGSKRRDDVLVAVADDAVQASAIFKVHTKRSTLDVPEYAWRTGAEDAFEALVAELMRRGQEAGVETLACDFGSDSAGRAVMSRLAEPAEVKEWTSLMFRIIDLAGLLQAAVPELSKRAAKAPRGAAGARLRLSWQTQSAPGRDASGRPAGTVRGAVLALDEGKLKVRGGSEDAGGQLDLDSAEMVQLIFGRGTAAVQDHLTTVPERERALVEALFPGERLVVWGTDSF